MIEGAADSPESSFDGLTRDDERELLQGIDEALALPEGERHAFLLGSATVYLARDLRPDREVGYELGATPATRPRGVCASVVSAAGTTRSRARRSERPSTRARAYLRDGERTNRPRASSTRASASSVVVPNAERCPILRPARADALP